MHGHPSVNSFYSLTRFSIPAGGADDFLSANRLNRMGFFTELRTRSGHITDDGFLLLASTPYSEIGVDHARAELKSHFLSTFAANVIRAEFLTLAEKMHVRTAILDWRSRTLKMVDRRGQTHRSRADRNDT